VARDRDQRAPEIVGHGFDEARLTAAGRAFQDQRQALAVGRLEHRLLIADRRVIGARACGLGSGAVLVSEP
jgi:hypothetical protein